MNKHNETVAISLVMVDNLINKAQDVVDFIDIYGGKTTASARDWNEFAVALQREINSINAAIANSQQ